MKQVQKFLLLGVVSTGIDYAVYTVAILLDIDYVIAIILGYSMGLWANYIIGRKLIFTSGHKLKSSTHELSAVVLIAVAGALFNIAIVKVLSYSLFHIDPLLSRIIAIGIVFFWNYFARKLWVYH